MKKQRIYTLLGTLSFDLTVALFLRCSVSPFFFYPFFLFLSFQPCCGSLLAACLACFRLSVSGFLLLACLL